MSNPIKPTPSAPQFSPDVLIQDQYESIDLREIFGRVGRGFGQTVGLALVGLVAAAVVYLAVCRALPVATSTRVVFSFPGFEKGQYPDGSNFSPDDLAAPDVIADALKREGFDPSSSLATTIRAALNVSGIIPSDVAKARDRAQSLGQTAPLYVPDEYTLTLTLKRSFPLSRAQRDHLLNAIVNSYRDKFERSYVNIPLAFGNAFETLKNADYFEYEQVLPEEISNIRSFLNQQLGQAKNFRSGTTNLSFSDLLNQTELFSQIRLNEILGIIRANGLSRNRALALVKMNYFLRTLQDQEHEAIEDEKVVQDLLAKSETHSQNYVLGVKSEAVEQRPGTPVLDQGLIDSLLANDAYSLLVRKALEAGLNVKHIQSEEAKLNERKKDMEALAQGANSAEANIISQVDSSLGTLKVAYDDLVEKIRRTQNDFARQQFADAITLSDNVHTDGTLRPLAQASAIGLFLGAALGIGLSLLGVFLGTGKRT